LFAICLGITYVFLGVLDLNVRGVQSNHIWITMALPLCGLGGLTSMMFAFAEGNTFLATAAGSLAGIIGGISLSLLPWTGIQASYIEAYDGNLEIAIPALYKALSIIFFCSVAPVGIIFFSSLRTAVPVSFSSFLFIVILTLSGVSYIGYPRVTVQHATGGIALATGVILMISALSVLLTEEGIHILPVMPLPRVD
jgi:succinate-acetate transporter protein